MCVFSICTSTHFFLDQQLSKATYIQTSWSDQYYFHLVFGKNFFPGKVTCNTFSKKYFINAQTEKEANDLTGKNSIYICVPLTIWTKSVICEHRISLLDNAPRYLVVCIIQKRFLHKFHYFSIFKLSVLCILKNRTWFTQSHALFSILLRKPSFESLFQHPFVKYVCIYSILSFFFKFQKRYIISNFPPFITVSKKAQSCVLLTIDVYHFTILFWYLHSGGKTGPCPFPPIQSMMI